MKRVGRLTRLSADAVELYRTAQRLAMLSLKKGRGPAAAEGGVLAPNDCTTMTAEPHAACTFHP
jgi:hypothetical protein